MRALRPISKTDDIPEGEIVEKPNKVMRKSPPKFRESEPPTYKPRRRGCLPRFNCRDIGCLLLVLIISFIGLIFYIITQHPPLLWEPFKSIVNNGITVEVNNELPTNEEVVTSLQQQILASGTHVNLTEQQIASLLQTKFNKQTVVDLEKDVMTVYVNLETDHTLQPLWLVIDLRNNDKGIPYIAKIGTGLISLPPFVNDISSTLLQNLLGISNSGSTNSGLINILLTASSNIKITNLQFDKDEMHLTIEFKVNFKDIFPWL